MSAHSTSFRKLARATAATALCASFALTSSIALAPAIHAAPVTAPNVVDLGIAEALSMLESGQTTSVALTQEYLARIAAYDNPYADQPGLAAVILANPDALATAAVLDAERAAGTLRGALHGIPIVVKDNYATFDMPTTAGSASLHTYQTAVDSTAVARLRAAGAIIIAKTNMAEFAWHGTFTLSSTRRTVPADPAEAREPRSRRATHPAAWERIRAARSSDHRPMRAWSATGPRWA
jgi:amidase